MKYHEIRLDSDGKPDDIVLQCDSLHLERLDDGVWWLAACAGDKRTVITLATKRGAPVEAIVSENALAAPEVPSKLGIQWSGARPSAGETHQ